MSVEKELWERVLGSVATATIEGIYGSGCLETLVQSNAVKLLQQIQDILNNKGFSDVDCMKEIVCLFEHAGLSVDRH